MEHFVYILKCSDDTLYIGYTNDIEKRLVAHNTSNTGAKYTRGRRPVALKYFEKFETKSEAMKREAVLKKMTRKEKLALL